ncbi:MAG: hypothetical protein PHE28_01615 [Bacteroidales bacterium]|jgi:Spy/CpxP family protein refolding chaperone|nr:hypothetical protein [Bacteroidales bacterium]
MRNNLFMKKQYFIIISIIVIALLIANIFFFINKKSCKCDSSHSAVEMSDKSMNSNCFVSKSLNFDDEQAKKYDIIKKTHQSMALKAIDSLHVSQEMLMDYLASNENDAQKIEELQDRIISFQKELLNQHVGQYQDLKAILKPEQEEPMNKLFKSLFVCEPSCNHSH